MHLSLIVLTSSHHSQLRNVLRAKAGWENVFVVSRLVIIVQFLQRCAIERGILRDVLRSGLWDVRHIDGLSRNNVQRMNSRQDPKRTTEDADPESQRWRDFEP